MRILLANEELGRGSGSGLYVLQVAGELAARGHPVALLAGDPSARDNGPGPWEQYFAPEALGFVHRSDAAALRPVRNALADFRPDLIYTHQVLSPAAAGIFVETAPTVRYAHDIRLTCPTGRRLPRTRDVICEYRFSPLCYLHAFTQQCMPRRPDVGIRVLLDVARNRRQHRRMEKIVVPSGFLRDLLVRNGFAPGAIEVIPYFTDLPDGPDAEPEGRRVLCAGRLTAEKGIDLLIDALASLPEPCHLDVAGAGPEEERLRRKAGEAEGRVRVRFHGWLSARDLSLLYRRAAVVAFPSCSPETFGLVGVEAMAHRRPVVAFDVGGVREWLAEGETGYAVPRKDVAALAGRIDRLLRDRDLARRFGARGRAVVEERFTAEAHLGKLLPLFHSVLADVAQTR